MLDLLFLAVGFITVSLSLYVIIRVIHGRGTSQQRTVREVAFPGDDSSSSGIANAVWHAQFDGPVAKPFDGLADALGASTELSEELSVVWSAGGENSVTLEYASTGTHAWEVLATRGQGDRSNQVVWRVRNYRTVGQHAAELDALRTTLTTLHDYYTARGASVTQE